MYRITTVAECLALDEGEVLCGYLDGVRGMLAPTVCSVAYRHGWRNGLVDAGFAEPDEDQCALDAAFDRLRPV